MYILLFAYLIVFIKLHTDWIINLKRVWPQFHNIKKNVLSYIGMYRNMEKFGQFISKIPPVMYTALTCFLIGIQKN